MKCAAFALPLLMLHAQAASAQQPSPAPAPKERWDLSSDVGDCSLTRQAPLGDEATLALRITPGMASPTLVMIVAAKANIVAPERGKFTVELAPTGFTSVRDGTRERVSNDQMTILSLGMDERFLGEFAKASELSVLVGDKKVRVAMKGAAKALQAFQKCIDDQLAEWGVEPRAFASLRSRPEGKWQQGVTIKDYPEGALRSGKGGMTVIRAMIGVDGRVQNCAVVRSSGTKELDEQTCAILSKRGKFKPAVAADGTPVAALLVDALLWQPPRGRR